jgi:hypothetical protein
MDERNTTYDGRMTAGRKGIPYDWQGVLADRELEALLIAGAPIGASASESVGASTMHVGHR